MKLSKKFMAAALAVFLALASTGVAHELVSIGGRFVMFTYLVLFILAVSVGFLTFVIELYKALISSEGSAQSAMILALAVGWLAASMVVAGLLQWLFHS